MPAEYKDVVSSEERVSITEAGDEDGLIAAFMLHRARIARFISLRCGGNDADDLLQELWLKARAVGTPVERPLGYLYRMADRLVLDRRRGASRGRSREGDWAHAYDRLSDASEPAFAERRLLARERLSNIDEALNAVGERAALIFRRYRLDGIAQRDIAEELGVSVSTVEKDLRRIYDALLSIEERTDEE
jgi:RNA polymerase sigma-70 factor (ECF subfamily)